MEWLDNISSIINEEKAGVCPFCGSDDVDYRVIATTENYGYADIWCNQCKKAAHFSRVKTSSTSKVLSHKAQMPQGLDF